MTLNAILDLGSYGITTIFQTYIETVHFSFKTAGTLSFLSVSFASIEITPNPSMNEPFPGMQTDELEFDAANCSGGNTAVDVRSRASRTIYRVHLKYSPVR
jgi:hypothetical protein